MTNQNKAPATPDFSHRYDDCPPNNIINAACQIDTVLGFLYSTLEEAQTLPPASHLTVDRLISDQKMLINCVNDALHIIDSLNRDVKAIVKVMDY